MSIASTQQVIDEAHNATIVLKMKDSKRTPDSTIQSLSTQEVMEMEDEYAAHTYHPLPVCFERAQGVHVWDPEGKHYYDFLSAYSAVNQGHCHPKIVEALTEQIKKCTLSSRAFYNNVFPQFCKYITEYFGYEMVLPMNTGAEAVETAIKLARRWGYVKKQIPNDEAIVICCEGCFHGRTAAAISMSNDPSSYKGFGALLPGFLRVPYDDLEALEAVLREHGPKVAGFVVEPMQGEAGVVVPSDGYLRKAYDLCKKYNVMFVADEIQTGLCRTGKMLCCDWDNFQPDVVLLGKALSGGLLPISAVLSSKEIMLTIKSGEHGSTYGGNPLSSAVAIAALQVLKDEKLDERAQALGEKFRSKLQEMVTKYDFVEGVRGRGLLNALIIKAAPETTHESWAWQFCLRLAKNGLLAKPTHDHIIRLAPPLVITDAELDDCLAIIESTLVEFEAEIRNGGAARTNGVHH
jgi:ornithine--oxo-acid transaminase